jgi:hypothetical protein
MKIVILAERAANAGLTQDEAFPMMKKSAKFDHHGGTEARRSADSRDFVLVFSVAP